MSRTRWSCLVLSFLFSTSAVGCRGVTPDEIATPAATLSATPLSVETITPTLTAEPAPTDTPIPVSPTPDETAVWQTLGMGATSLQLAVPPNWVDLSNSLPQEALTTPLGVTAVFAADSARTGASLLANKPIGAGAFVLALVASADVPPTVPVAGLGLVLAQIETAVTPLSDITTFQTGNLNGAAIDVQGMPLPNFRNAAANLRTRIVYFLAPGLQPGQTVEILLIFSAAAEHWPDFAETIAHIGETAVLPNPQASLRIPNGTVRFLSYGQGTTQAYGAVDNDTPDIWMLSVNTPQYLTLTAAPASSDMDLTLSLIDPTGQTMSRLNNGYSGDSEMATDIPLPEPGLYLLMVNDFARGDGRYTLNINLSNTPMFDGRGHINFGEGVQSQLAADSQHIWIFEGAAGQYASIVLQPGSEQFDAILNLYGPDGTRLVALDEGFSGDPEVASGFQLPVTGEYSILVSSFASAGGMYTLSLSKGHDETANFYDAGDLMYGQTKQETFRPNEAHAWFFQGKAGEEVVIRATPLTEALDLDVWLLDPNVERLAAQDLFMAGEAEIIQQTLSLNGQYLVLVREFSGNAGGYEIALDLVPTAVPVYIGTLEQGIVVNDALPAEQTNFWLFNAQADDQVTITLSPNDANGDLVLLLQAPNGDTLLRVDDAAAGEAETITAFPLNATGQWRILVQEFLGDAASYALTATWNQ
ncbi:MAG: PPC domain-containing protein [Ardenticatenaceae bacterium]|nr:PPC domain-containing protein [Anaerolineales bacterium]MCB8920968.1 PPC domain-containing protein [Ardenticatenaceae bacterium]MCB8991606.1 PPC domain-containing protein [Ardenticatenaceae bacterium]MCB9004235.1 PPC domain-containing protein [Ardenticatenaceae bacterium]